MRLRIGRDVEDSYEKIRVIAETLEVPSPWTLEGMVEAVAVKVGRKIMLRPLDDLPPEISGVSMPVSDKEDEDTFIVFYDSRVPVWSQVIIVLHELGHHLLGHDHRRVLTAKPDPARPDRIGTRAATYCGLTRTSFLDPLEVDAERFATIMADRIERLQRSEFRPELDSIRRGMEPRNRWSDR